MAFLKLIKQLQIIFPSGMSPGSNILTARIGRFSICFWVRCCSD
jgi:hypothetical protein